MFWTVVDRVVNLTFLLLAIITITMLLNNTSDNTQSKNIDSKIELYKEQNMKVMSNNVSYMEGRINRQSEQQDSYQNSTDQRLSIIESQIKLMLSDKKSNQKIINNNNSNAVIYQDNKGQEQ